MIGECIIASDSRGADGCIGTYLLDISLAFGSGNHGERRGRC
jgi:hypothetical protein